jgi:hypothetical protein
MEHSTTLLVARNDISLTETSVAALPSSDALAPGEVLLAVDQFAFTANNITYAVMGDLLRYWEFFPAAEGKGVVPVWGFADVIASASASVEVGERLYGYYPMSSHLTVKPEHISTHGFVDGAAHRQPLSVIYNQYIRCAQDPLYSAQTEALQMLLRPLFTTSFLLDDFFSDNQFFGANSLVLTSASSKTALGMAFLLEHNRSASEHSYEIVGLTSPSNIEFVQALGCYDRVLSYDQLTQLDAGSPTATVDFAGNAELLTSLHNHFNEQLQYSCRVGASHWDQGGATAELPGPEPQMFFAPTQAQKRIAEWGGPEFQQRLASVWLGFLSFVEGWMEVEIERGPEAAARVYGEILSGQFSPKAGYILSMHD